MTQIVFAKAAAGLPQFRGEAQASTWLYRIAANVVSDWLRSRAAREAKLALHAPAGPESAMTAALADPQPSPEQRLARKDMQDCIRDEIGKLPAGSQDVLLLGELARLHRFGCRLLDLLYDPASRLHPCFLRLLSRFRYHLGASVINGARAFAGDKARSCTRRRLIEAHAAEFNDRG